MTKSSTNAPDLNARREALNKILQAGDAELAKLQPCVAKRTQGCGYAILAADTASLATQILEIAQAVETGSPCDETPVLRIPEMMLNRVISPLQKAGCKVTSDRSQPKEPFDVYRFRLQLPTGKDTFKLARDLQSVGDQLEAAAMALYIHAAELLSPTVH